MNQNEVENEVKHWGILGMHWGIRRYQNPDGSLTPEGRERYLKNPNNTKDNSYNEEGKKKFVDPKYFHGNSNKVNIQAVTDALNDSESPFSPKLSKMQYEFLTKETKNNKYGVSLYSTVLYADNKDFKKFMESDDHSRDTLKKYLDSKWPFTFEDSDIDPLYNYIINLDKFNNEGTEFITKQVDKLGVSDSKRDYLIKALYDFYIDPVAGVQIENEEDELKHWGILGMKWGIRNYQNPDGSLTPLGRIRYGVGAKKEITGNIAGVNDANSLSDEELKRMTRRYQQQADYYQARNNYISQERYFKQNTAPKQKGPSAIGNFISNVFGKPLTNFMAKNVELGLSVLPYELIKSQNPELANLYLGSLTGLKKDKPDPVSKSKKDADIARNNKNEINDRQFIFKIRKSMLDLLSQKANDPNVDMDEFLNLVYEYENIFNEDYDPTKYRV